MCSGVPRNMTGGDGAGNVRTRAEGEVGAANVGNVRNARNEEIERLMVSAPLAPRTAEEGRGFRVSCGSRFSSPIETPVTSA